MFTTIREKLLVTFLLFISVTIVSSILVFDYFLKSRDSLTEITQRFESTYILLLEDAKVMNSFFEKEVINPKFFETGKSVLLESHYKTCEKIETSLSLIFVYQKNKRFELDDHITRLRKNFSKYKILTNNIAKQILIRGFKDHGIEGSMRNYAHALEKYQKEIGLVNILQLRRHEKDFIIRQEEAYIFKYEKLLEEIKKTLYSNSNIPLSEKNNIESILDNYSIQFHLLTIHEKNIGLKTQGGMKKSIDNISRNIENDFNSIIQLASLKEKAGLMHAKAVFMIIWILFIIIGIVVSIFISKRASTAITHLTESISDFVKSDFTKRTVFPENNSTFEVDVLIKNFSIMEQHIVNQMDALKQTNKELEMFFYKASHDIKSPLSTVKGITNLASLEIKDPIALRYLSMINRSWQNLSVIIDELGMITDIKAQEITTTKINFELIFQSVMTEFKVMQEFENILFSIQISIKEPFYSSERLIKTIFRHLIENGIKYSTKRETSSFIKIVVSLESREMLRIMISDNGIGIKKEHHNKIFDMFFRGTTQAHGTGLGLYIVKNSLQKLNGAISVESEEGKGAVFTVLLPNKIKKEKIAEQIILNKTVSSTQNNLVLNYF